jgi:DNA-binding MarR family transcriptional regulator
LKIELIFEGHDVERSGTRSPELAGAIVEHLMRRHSTATVLFHHAVAERLGIGPTDHKCLDLLRERGAMTGSELAAATGLTSGAVTVAVARLERAGYLHREPDPHDRRKQVLSPAPERTAEIHAALAPIRRDVAALLGQFDEHQLGAIATFLEGTAALLYRNSALLRVEPAHTPVRGEAVPLTRPRVRSRG